VTIFAARRRGTGSGRDPEGRMPLLEHLRELRKRVTISVLALVPGTILGWVYYDHLIRWLSSPICDVQVTSNAGGGHCGPLVINGLLGPFNLQVKVALAAGVFLASPVWLYELWAFVTPGLHRNERRWTIGFLATGVPLFFVGAAVCYWILPRATKLLLGFTPDGVGSLVDFNEFLSIVVRLMLVFGLAFEVPVFIVLLNLVGVLPSRRLLGWWRQLVFGVFLFAAVATPTGDPFTMTALAAPLCVLVAIAYGVCRLAEARRGSRDLDYGRLDDDETSPLDDPVRHTADDEASPLDPDDDR
jgi:sec-independent protein translocase protein TatC